MDRRTFILGSSIGVFGLRVPANAQSMEKLPRIGFLGATSEAGLGRHLDAFRSGLRDLGYVDGKTCAIDYRWAEGDYARLPEIAAKLVELHVDVLVTHGTPGTRAAQRATSTIPIVMVVSGDAVGTGIVPSLSRPGGNVTGSTFFNPEITAKRLELLKEALPTVTRVAFLLNPDNPAIRPTLKTMAPTAAARKMELQLVEARSPVEIEQAFSVMTKTGADAFVSLDDRMLVDNAKAIAGLAAANRLPGAGPREFADAGGLLAYAVNYSDLYRRAALFVDKILKGTKPSDIPVEQATRFEVVINLKTAKALGLTIPQPLLLRADEVIQ
jgi:putative tryptophan/tyrosine transport system substrate-binding protein